MRSSPISIPPELDAPVFKAPWEAQAFALVVHLQARAVFTWKEWAATLSEEIKRAQAAGDPDHGDTYYLHWLAALERIVSEKGLSTGQALTRYRLAWQHAAARTAHGRPIDLKPEDFEALKALNQRSRA